MRRWLRSQKSRKFPWTTPFVPATFMRPSGRKLWAEMEHAGQALEKTRQPRSPFSNSGVPISRHRFDTINVLLAAARRLN